MSLSMSSLRPADVFWGCTKPSGLGRVQRLQCRTRRSVAVRAAADDGKSAGPKMSSLDMESGRSRMSDAPEGIKPTYAPKPLMKPKTVSFFDAMKFNGPGPELINSRLAMVGTVCAAVNEIKTGATIEEQILNAPVTVGVFILAIVYATLVPIMKGVKSEAFGFMSPRAEVTNGRAAMLAFLVILVLEVESGIPFF